MLFTDRVSPCQRVESSLFGRVQLWIKRDDMLHPQVSGNKFRKLKYPLRALQGRAPHLVTMGGPWSNHLHALAHAAALYGYPATALVRGSAGMHSATLDDCRRLGMQVQFVSRIAYRQLRDDSEQWRLHLAAITERHVWLPEGGSAPSALRGVAELVGELPFVPDAVVVASGTGATLAGLVAGMRGRGRLFGVAALKNAGYLRTEIAALLQAAGYEDNRNYELLTDCHCGGYGKTTPALLQFCAQFSRETGIALEPVYTGKMLFALQQLARAGVFSAQEKVLAVHTGGLQGARGFADFI
ncbi:MAG: pyridoxal-phosphate dependent enzyme [Burkholderiales bacterium]|nr:pyridoxal-phosphate dependent enzyme [Burkholderiales bacterium]